MDALVLAFTLKGQEVTPIVEEIKKLAKRHPKVILIHGFMPRRLVVEKGWPTTILDALDENFPVQLNMFCYGYPLRDEMADVAKLLNANVVVIGPVIEGVAEEVELYKSMGLEIYNVSIPPITK